MRGAEEKVQIEIYVDGTMYGERRWPAVPRVGDHLLVRGMVEGDRDALSAVKVIRILWGGNFHSRAYQEWPIVRLDTEVLEHNV
jgi:hypothetical protein